jgi:hypothetical protein
MNPLKEPKIENLPYLQIDVNKFKPNSKQADDLFDQLLDSFTNWLKNGKKISTHADLI